MRSVSVTLRALLLGNEPRQQMRASQAMLVLLVYVVFSVVQHGEVLAGLIEEAAAWSLTAWNVGGSLCFYLVIRSGINERLRRENARLQQRLSQAEVIISVQKKLSQLLGIPLPKVDDEEGRNE